MTYKEKVAYLESYQSILLRIDGLSHELQKWEDIAVRINQNYSPVPFTGSGNNSKVEGAAVNAANISHVIYLDLISAIQARDSIKRVINERCKKLRYRELIEAHYIHGLSMGKIARNQKREYQATWKMMKSAIDSLDI